MRLVLVVAMLAVLAAAAPMSPEMRLADEVVRKLATLLPEVPAAELAEMPLELALRAIAGPQTAEERREHAEALRLLEPDNLHVPMGFSALAVCSAVFVSGIDEEVAIREDASGAGLPCTIEVDYAEQSVVAFITAAPQHGSFKAIFRGPTLGCTLVGAGVSEAELRAQDTGTQQPIPPLNASVPWPLGEGPPAPYPPGVDGACIEAVVEENFANTWFNTRATAIVYNGELIFERYADTVSAEAPLLGWSMTKSVLSALVGMVAEEGLIDISAPADVPEWAGDARANITVDEMLRMSSGVLWTESYHLVLCLYETVDCAKYYTGLRLVDDPDTNFVYSTGTSYLLSRILAEKRGQREINTFDWHRERLFRPMGMSSALIEFAPQQYLGGGSYAYFTVRDWARFGHLYMRKGDWFGQRLISEAWAEYTCTDSSTAPDEYGAHWWRTYKSVDPDMCYCSGFRKQNVFNMPNRGVTVVRHAMPSLAIGWLFDAEEYLHDLMACFPQ